MSTAFSSRWAAERGAEVLRELPAASAEPERRREPRRPRSTARPSAWDARLETRATSATCSPDTLEHSRWDDVAARCLTCGNCTMVCPTCFCSTVEDVERPRRRGGRAPPRLGLVLLRRPRVHPRRQHPPERQVALPAVADPQVRHLARPVRHVRLCRLRPLHHVVPGRHRRHRGARRAPHPEEERR